MTFRDLIDSPIAYHRCFVAIAGSVSGAVFLSQVCYWSKRTKCEDGFFYKTAEEWEEETGIPQRTQDRIRAALRLKGILVEKLIGVPATLYFKLDIEALLKLFPDSPSGETEIRQVANHLDSPSGETISEITNDYSEHGASQTDAPRDEVTLKFPKPEKRQPKVKGYRRAVMNGRSYEQAPRESPAERSSREAREQIKRVVATLQVRGD